MAAAAYRSSAQIGHICHSIRLPIAIFASVSHCLIMIGTSRRRWLLYFLALFVPSLPVGTLSFQLEYSMSVFRRLRHVHHRSRAVSSVRHQDRKHVAIAWKDDVEQSCTPLSSRSRPTTDADDIFATRKIEFELHPSITSISAESWNCCLAPDGSSSPFLEHAWLECLESSGCASPKTGWVPQHVGLTMDGQPIGYVPLYLKGHSMGEFIFDNSWAEAAYQNGINYYPKILVGIPFTPATGQRILLHPTVWNTFSRDEIRKLRVLVATFLQQLARGNKISSVHFNFLTDEEATDLSGELPEPAAEEEEKEDSLLPRKVQEMLHRLASSNAEDSFYRRTSLQYHWTNSNSNNDGKPYESFDDYLGCFKSKRRITIRRERQKVMEDEGIRIDAIVGRDILKYEGLVERMFHIYKSTVDKMIWGRQYLTLDFFERLANSDFVDNLCFLCARHKSQLSDNSTFCANDVFAGTFNIVKNGVFYGRYWGCLPGQEVKNLHFETCYWSAIEFCIDNGLQRMEPGAGGGDYKWARGFDAALIHSAHYVCHPGLRRAVAQFLEMETQNNVELTEYLRERSAVRSKAKAAS